MPSTACNRLLGLLLLSLWVGLTQHGCGAGAVGSATSSETAPPLVEAEAVDDALRTEVDRRLAERDEHGLQELSVDLTPGVQLLALLRSPRAASLAHELSRLPPSTSLDVDSWGGRQLLRWTHALLQWELTGAPDYEALHDLYCLAPEGPRKVDTDVTLPPWQAAARASLSEGNGEPSASDQGTPAPNDVDETEPTSGDGDYSEPEDTRQPADRSQATRAWAAFEREQAATLRAYGQCVIERMDAAFEGTDKELTPLQRASFGALYETAHSWLLRRTLPIDDGALLGADDIRLRSARAWTGLSSVDPPYHTTGLMVALRSTGVHVAFRPAVFGAQLLEQAEPPRCSWPGREVLAFTAAGRQTPQSVLREGLDALTQELDACEQHAPNRQAATRALIDAGLHWEAIGPVLRALVSTQRTPSLLVHEAQSGRLSALPVELRSEVPSTTCGVEAHMRRDGVVLRGGGSPLQLLSWSEGDAFTKLTEAAHEAVERCAEAPLVRIFVDDPSVDWGLIVRVIERMSWPQACGDRPCLRSALIVGGS